MNRVNKFRVWDTKRKVQVSDEYLCIQNGCLTVPNGYHNPDDCFIQQFTGLLDKNGKEIYEGDIVEFSTMEHKSIKKLVEISNGLLIPFYDSNYTDDEQGDWFTSGFEVIGNIFENPDLLK